MGSKSRVRLDCRAISYLSRQELPPPVGDLKRAFLDSRSNSPARWATQARSDLGFVDRLVDTLVKDGLNDVLARSVALALLTTPTVAAQRRESDGSSRYLQSVVLTVGRQLGDLQVIGELVTCPSMPPTLSLLSVDTYSLDLANEADQLELVAAVEGWTTAFPMPAMVHPDPLPIPDWAWMGDLRNVGLQGLPPDWRERLNIAGAVYGRTPLIAETDAQARRTNLADRVDFVIAAPSAKWAATIVSQATRHMELHTTPEHLLTFDALLMEVRRVLLARALAGVAPTPPQRELLAGEIIYHRKVGSSRKFDNFDEGSTSPCAHGADNYVNWGGDKARKGMHRRYSNFNEGMLIHCKRYPNCGVYGVDAARGGLR